MIETLRHYTSLKELIERCDSVVCDVLSSSTIPEAAVALESFKNGGKRLRPALVFLSSQVTTGRPIHEVPAPLISLAGAIELIHLASLFHDDVIDEVDVRRSKISARAKYGNHASVLAGDYAFTEALHLVEQAQLSQTMPEFLRTIRVLVKGESRETMHSFNLDINEATYYEIISEKSASLFALSCKVGALSHSFRFADTLGHFGWNLGMAFQMIDDLDDMLAHPKHASDSDLQNGYLALPVIKLLSNLGDGYRDRLVKIITDKDFSHDNEIYIVSLCNEMGTIQHCNDEIHKHLEHAGHTLRRFRQSEAKDLLLHIISDLKNYTNNQIDNLVKFSTSGSQPFLEIQGPQ